MIKKWMLFFSFPFFSFSVIAPFCHADAPSDYVTGITLQLPGQEAFYRVELPLAVHAQARPDLADLRVFNAAGESVPYALGTWRDADVPAKPPELVDVPRFPLHSSTAAGLAGLDVKIEQTTAGKVIALRSANATAAAPAKIMAYVFDVSALDKDIQALLLDWPASATGYSAQGMLEASDDLKTWRYLGPAPLLEMNFSGQQLAQKRIAFTRGRYHYLRLSADQALPAFSLAHVESPTATGVAATPRRWQKVTATAGAKAGEYLFDAGARLTVSGIGLLLPQNNTVAPLELFVRDRTEAPWQPVIRTVSYRLTREGRDINSPALEINPQSGRFWRVQVDARAGGLGNGMPVLTLGWAPRQLVFVARGAGPFTLAFGRHDALPSQLPLTSLMPGYAPGAETALPSATLGATRALGGTATGPAPVTMDWKKAILWSVLLLGVALLAWMAKGLMQQVKPEA